MTNRSTKNTLTVPECAIAVCMRFSGRSWPYIDKHFGYPKSHHGKIAWKCVGRTMFPKMKGVFE